MRIYFSGSRGLTYTPEGLIPHRKPHIMLTFYDIDGNGTSDRVENFLHPKKGGPYAHTVFMDSGAYSLFNDEVEKRRDKVPRKSKDPRFISMHGEHLNPPKVRRGQGDYSFYEGVRVKNSPFRKYCRKYARFQKEHADSGMMFVNVDAIMNPDLTWEIQQYFENELGVRPVPVIHGLTPMKYLDRYLEAGHELIGLGGLGHAVSMSGYMRWADQVFLHICPKSKGYLPQVRVHGFAMTAHKLICRYPWWSVDSATWVKLAAYGWLYVPRWSDERGWLFHKPPMQVNLSFRSPLVKKEDKHIDNVSDKIRDVIWNWVEERCEMKRGTTGKDGKMIEFGVTSHFRARSKCNLNYMKDLEESRPKWPHALNPSIVEERAANYAHGFGL